MTIRNLLYPLLTFCGILLTATFWVQVLGIQDALESTGLKLQHWLLIDVAWILSGAFVCWALSRDMSLWATSSLLFEASDEVEFTQRVHELSKNLGLVHPLQIASYPSPEVNAFIAGPTRKRSVLSVSKGFLALPADQQIKLLTPEILKLSNGSNTLLIVCQGMTYGFNLYLARVVALLLGTSLLSSEGETSSTKAEVIVSIVTTTFLTFFGSLVLGHLSRTRHRIGDQEYYSILEGKSCGFGTE
jgi:heat shock protein HtpX